MASEPTQVADLIHRVRQGERVKFLFFWGHQPERGGGIGRSCLSQWWPAAFDVDGRTFATAEHYMMWRKAMLFDDLGCAEKVLRASHPRQAKELGRRVLGFDQRQWDEHRFEIVVAACVAKFGQHADLRSFLIGTGDQVLVEASPTDSVWGIGLAANDPRAEDPAQWQGLNLLGFALADARSALLNTVS